jgi:hypothetical protein
MKKILALICILFLVGCFGRPPAEPPPADDDTTVSQPADKDTTMVDDDAQAQIQALNDALADLQTDYDTLQGEYNEKVSELLALQNQSGDFICENAIPNMKYENAISAIAIVEGWFALQPHVGVLQGTYTTQFWQNVESRMHTIRYISTEDNLSTTATFLIFFEEGGWGEALLNMTDQCWLDPPG